MMRLITILFLLLNTVVFAQDGRVSFNSGWKFFLGDPVDAQQASFDDASWRTLDLPHDWSIEGKFDERNPAKPEGGGLPAGIGWYRKTFTVSGTLLRKRVAILFDGIYRNSEVWVNGHYLGKRPNGYISFQYDIEKYLAFGSTKNVVAVRVDNSGQPNSRWYSGSGMYRNTWLEITDKAYIDPSETSITTVLAKTGNAKVIVNVGLRSPEIRAGYAVAVTIRDAAGKPVANLYPREFAASGDLTTYSIAVPVVKPRLWSTVSPNTYRLSLTLYRNSKKLDTRTIAFGIRAFAFNAKSGFSLNGSALRIKGVCLHHDLGALGAAFNTRAAQRQLELMKAMGVNAIRTSHNPPAPEFLALCDSMGFLVMDEAFDMWKKKKTNADYHLDWDEWHRRDLEDQIKRDRNHPSVIWWSIGNEIREQFDSTGVAMTKELVKIVKDLDPTRPVTSALTETNPAKNFIYQAGVLDMYGLNYNHKLYHDFPAAYPGVKLIATETTSALETRGFYDMPADSIRRWPKDGKTKFTDGNPAWAASAYDNVSAYWGSTHEETLKAFRANANVAGIFVWTGFDYLGEPTPYPWPARSSYFGIVDLAGFPKDSYYLYQSLWTSRPVLHLLPHWNWTPGKIVDVWAYYSQADEVELFLNGRSLGTKHRSGDDLHVSWRVAFEPGTLRAVSRKSGKAVLTEEVHTATDAARIELVADHQIIAADGNDLSFVTVRIVDNSGTPVPTADNLVTFEIDGAGKIAGVDNGFQASLEPFKASYRKAYNGLCLAIIQSTGKKGPITLRATSPGLASANLLIQAK